MLCLLLWIGFSDQWAAESITCVQPVKQALALAFAYFNLKMLLNALGQALAIP